LLYVLKIFKIPTLILELMLLIYRFIFVFIEIAINIYTAQSSRLGHCSIRKSINSFGLLFANLWGKGFFKSQALFTSLLSRGYKDELKVLYKTYQFSIANIVTYSFFVLLLLVVGVTL
jgi:cobalt/nickel transport system permease protein